MKSSPVSKPSTLFTSIPRRMNSFDVTSAAADLFSRRAFLTGSAATLGLTALNTLLPQSTQGSSTMPPLHAWPHLPVKAKRVIYLFQSGAPSQMDLFDHKPMMESHFGKDLPDSVRKGQRLTGMTSGQSSLPIAPSVFKFKEHGESRATISELMPHIATVADELCFIKSMHTEAINHDPAITFFQTGRQIAGYPSMGSWLSYGLGSANQDLPAFVVLTSFGSGRKDCQPLASRLWGSGFLPSEHQGVKFRNSGDPVLYLSNPAGLSAQTRRHSLDMLNELNGKHLGAIGDPEIQTRISQYEMAFRMQTSVPELTDLKKEPQHVLDLYGPDVLRPGSYAANCLLARRLAERDVRFVQLFHMGWDQHFTLPKAIRGQCHDTDQPTAALIKDLKQRGLLDDTLIVWGGEFGRTIYSQGKLTQEDYGRDHHPRCFTVFLAGGGIKPGMTLGETDDFSYNIVRDPVSIFDLHATMLNRLGIEHARFTHKFQGLDAKLTGVETAKAIGQIMI